MMCLKRNRAVVAVVAVLILTGVAMANAQVRNAASKARGQAFSRSSTRALQQSRNVSRDFRSYVQRSQFANQPIAPTVARPLVAELAQNVKLTQQYLAEEKKEFAGDTNTLAALELVEKHVQAEADQQAVLADLVQGDNIDAGACIKVCEGIEASIENALNDHNKMWEQLDEQ